MWAATIPDHPRASRSSGRFTIVPHRSADGASLAVRRVSHRFHLAGTAAVEDGGNDGKGQDCGLFEWAARGQGENNQTPAPGEAGPYVGRVRMRVGPKALPLLVHPILRFERRTRPLGASSTVMAWHERGMRGRNTSRRPREVICALVDGIGAVVEGMEELALSRGTGKVLRTRQPHSLPRTPSRTRPRAIETTKESPVRRATGRCTPRPGRTGLVKSFVRSRLNPALLIREPTRLLSSSYGRAAGRYTKN